MVSRFDVVATIAAVGAAAKTIGNIKQSATPRSRPIVTGIRLGFNGTPADNAFLSDLVRCDATGAGASTPVTPAPRDAGDVASNLTAAENFTAEATTVGSVLAEFPQHQRTTIIEQYAEENGFVLTGTASFQILLRTLHASYASAASGTISYRE